MTHDRTTFKDLLGKNIILFFTDLTNVSSFITCSTDICLTLLYSGNLAFTEPTVDSAGYFSTV